MKDCKSVIISRENSAQCEKNKNSNFSSQITMKDDNNSPSH